MFWKRLFKKKTKKYYEDCKDAQNYRELLNIIQQKYNFSIWGDMVIMSHETFCSLYKDEEILNDKIEELEAKLVWYKMKYFELKRRNYK